MLDASKLEKIGLTHNESLVFIALLELGQTKTGPIVKKIGMHRVLLYDALESLIKKGLVSYIIKENIKYFQATNPENISKFIEEKKNIVDSLMPSIKDLMKKTETKQEVTFYEGLNGLKSALNNMLAELTSKDDHCVFASGLMEPTLKEYYYIYQKEKKRKKILTRGIVDSPYKERKELIKNTYANIRYYELGPFETDTWIYKDKVLIVIYTAKPAIAILITSKETANSYRKLFEPIWEKAKHV